MKTKSEIIKKHIHETKFLSCLSTEVGKLTIMRCMDEYAEQILNEYSNWLWEMGKLMLTNQLPPFDTPQTMTEYFLKAKIRTIQGCSDAKKNELVIPDVSNSVCSIPNCKKDVYKIGCCKEHYRMLPTR